MTPEHPQVSIVIPIYNEEENLPDLVERVGGALSPSGRAFELICVDDGSRDDSAALLAELAATRAWLKPFYLIRNYGQSAALQAGFDQAKGGIIVTLDGDLQNDPDDIGKLVAAVEDNGVDVASGRRQARADALMSRKLPSRAINGMLRKLTSVEISDYGCAFNAYRRDALEPVLHRIGRQKFTKALVLRSGATVEEVREEDHERRGVHPKPQQRASGDPTRERPREPRPQPIDGADRKLAGAHAARLHRPGSVEVNLVLQDFLNHGGHLLDYKCHRQYWRHWVLKVLYQVR
jgi:glycosyltransferase involved in cell wall biosynthesis